MLNKVFDLVLLVIKVLKTFKSLLVQQNVKDLGNSYLKVGLKIKKVHEDGLNNRNSCNKIEQLLINNFLLLHRVSVNYFLNAFQIVTTKTLVCQRSCLSLTTFASYFSDLIFCKRKSICHELQHFLDIFMLKALIKPVHKI